MMELLWKIIWWLFETLGSVMAWLCEVVRWLNENQGAAIVIVTSVYVIATLVIVFVSWRTVRQLKEANDLARKALDQSLAIEQNRNRPYVIFDFVVKGRYFYASLNNYGQRPAKDVCFVIIPKLLRSLVKGKSSELSFVGNKVPVIAPGQEILDLVGKDPDFMTEHAKTTFLVTLSYLDSEECSYNETTEIPIEHFRGRWRLMGEEPLDKIAEKLDKIAGKLRFK